MPQGTVGAWGPPVALILGHPWLTGAQGLIPAWGRAAQRPVPGQTGAAES